MKLGIIVNPYSRRNQKTNCRSMREFQNIGGDAVDVRATASLNDIGNVLASFRERNIDHIAISGGDGTIHNVITSIIHFYNGKNIPPILLLSDGTMNNVAASIGMNGKSNSVLKKYLNIVHANTEITLVKRDTLHIDDKYCFLFGFGLISNFLDEVYKDGKKGNWKNILVIKKLIAEAWQTRKNFQKSGSLFHPIDATIYIDKKKLNFDRVISCLCGTVEHIGMGFKPLYRANEQTGTFHNLITGMRPIEMVKKLGHIKKGKRIDHEFHLDELTTEMVIEADHSIKYTMDGDMYHSAEKLVVTVGPQVTFIVV